MFLKKFEENNVGYFPWLSEPTNNFHTKTFMYIYSIFKIFMINTFHILTLFGFWR